MGGDIGRGGLDARRGGARFDASAGRRAAAAQHAAEAKYRTGLARGVGVGVGVVILVVLVRGGKRQTAGADAPSLPPAQTSANQARRRCTGAAVSPVLPRWAHDARDSGCLQWVGELPILWLRLWA
jgi:hypothetical protein